MFFSVDIETSNTVVTPGGMLSIGVVAINDELEMVDNFYVKLAYDVKASDKETMEWWETQDLEAQAEAFDWGRSRVFPGSAAVMLQNWVNELKQNQEAYFVANPASFDFPWIANLFQTWELVNPFHYRTLCLRSMRFGITGGKFGSSRGEDEGFPDLKPVVPVLAHHALHDAIAQGQDFINLMGRNLYYGR